MKGDLLLVNPWILDFAAYNFWIEPIGLLTIASVLEENGYRVSLIDCLLGDPPRKIKHHNTWSFNKQVLPRPETLREFRRRYGRYGMLPDVFRDRVRALPRPDVVLVTSKMTYWYPGVFDAIRWIKEILPGTPVILGGTYATLCREHAIKYSGADHVISGEGEIQALEAVDRITEHDSDVSRYDLFDLDSIPFPAHRLVFELNPAIKYVALMTSRGCPMRCSYCASRLLHPTFRQRSVDGVIDEIDYCYRTFAIEDVAFYDDALLVNSDRHIIPILERIVAAEYPIRFHTPNGIHARLINKEIADLMFRAGFETIRIGLETTDPVRMRVTGGKTSVEEFGRAVTLLKNAGFSGRQIGAYLLAGLPGQPIDEVRKSIIEVNRMGVQAKIALFSPIPGTSEWREFADREIDPLLHNNTLMPMLDDREKEEMEKLKLLATELNAQL